MIDSCLGTRLVWLRFKGSCFSGSLTLAVSALGIFPRGITSLSPRLLTFTHRPGSALPSPFLRFLKQQGHFGSGRLGTPSKWRRQLFPLSTWPLQGTPRLCPKRAPSSAVSCCHLGRVFSISEPQLPFETKGDH